MPWLAAFFNLSWAEADQDLSSICGPGGQAHIEALVEYCRALRCDALFSCIHPGHVRVERNP